MDPANILPSIERLDDAVDTLEETLQPLIHNMTDVATKLPLLDKAKFYVLMTYSIESMLFSALRLNSVDAKEHPVFKELLRVRQYFDKIKNIEFPPQKPEQTLNKEAAIRFIRSDLADDKQVHTQLTEMIAKERAKAAQKVAKIGEKRKLEEAAATEKSSEEAVSQDSSSEDEDSQAEPVPQKKAKVAEEVKSDAKAKNKEKRNRRKQKQKKSKESSKKSSKD
ncbi:Sas10/Utp3/C1D family-domain-containing protein [Xylariaceae sp. FL0594]|nr:Sas10/Utp3/C1D family-domain-containing protein [Xylariaceae sp. FL0594]